MPKYNIFDEHINENIQEKHNLLLAQDKILFESSILINDAMLKANMTQTELASFLDISKGYMSRILSGTENISLKNLAKILYKLGYNITIQTTEIKTQDDNIFWADFSKNEADIHIESSVSELNSPWSNSISG
ncbi:MAG: helix-turn-helix transcriptional regulator [bacterium]|nr:helix-turn-helix transcriptional regulator [bacterium]